MRKLIISLLILASWTIRTKAQSPDFFPVSVWYSGGISRAPMLETLTPTSRDNWRRDLRQIKSLGFNTVRTWVEWAHCEPQPGQYHLENLKLLCELAQEVGLRVIVQLYVDSAPDWVGKKFPDGMYEAQSGDRIKSQAAPGFCTDHAGVREAVLNFITETARVASTYPNLHGWDLWSEPHIINWAYINYVPNATFCYCPNTQAAFREWLKKKYGTLEALNQAWYRNFDSWEDAEAPRFGTILSYTDFIDWKNFIYEKLAHDLRLRYEAVRRGDPSHVITSHAAVPSIFYSPYVGAGATDDFLMAEQIDYYGTSLYPKHSHPSTHWEPWKFQVAVDFSRSANRKNGGFYVGELQAGKGTYGLNIGNPITPEDHRLWMWSAVARGAKAINIYAYYPMSSGYESGGYGLINLDGTVTERAVAAGKTAAIITRNKDFILASKPVAAQVAIVYNPLAQMVGGEQRTVTTDLHQNSLLGYYRFFTEENIPVDFIHRRDLERDDLSQYRLIIVPYPLMFTETAAAGLKKYIANGGHALTEARLAWNDERGFAAPVIPGMGLEKVFGVHETSVKMGDRVALNVGSRKHPLLSFLAAGDTLWGANFAESLEADKNNPALVLATLNDGAAGLTVSLYGRGEAACIGTFLGMANHLAARETNNRFLRGLVEWAKIERVFTTSCDGVKDNPIEVRLMDNPRGFMLFIFNRADDSKPVQVQIKTPSDRGYRVRDLLHEEARAVESPNKKLNLDLTLSGHDVGVWEIQSR